MTKLKTILEKANKIIVQVTEENVYVSNSHFIVKFNITEKSKIFQMLRIVSCPLENFYITKEYDFEIVECEIDLAAEFSNMDMLPAKDMKLQYMFSDKRIHLFDCEKGILGVNATYLEGIITPVEMDFCEFCEFCSVPERKRLYLKNAEVEAIILPLTLKHDNFITMHFHCMV